MNKLVTGAGALALALSGALAATPAASATGPAHHGGGARTVWVKGDGSTVTTSRDTVRAGRIRFHVATTSETGSQILLFRLAGGATLAEFRQDVLDEFSPDPATAAKGTRELTEDVRFYGLADPTNGRPNTVTERLRRGTYYLTDFASFQGGALPKLTTLRVREGDEGDENRQFRSHWSHPTIRMTSADRFRGPRRLPAHGAVTVRNTSDTIHFMEVVPVKRGTTDAEVQAFFDSGAQGEPSFALDGPGAGLEPLSPGNTARFGYRLPAGTYVLLCFVADDETGIPHAVMGMHKVVLLRR